MAGRSGDQPGAEPEPEPARPARGQDQRDLDPDADADRDPGAVVELPLPAPPVEWHENTLYLLNSTVHWRPIVNGYSGFVPPSYYARRVDLASFPADDAIAVLRNLGVRYAVVHREAFSRRGPDALSRLEASPHLRLLIDEGDIAIYRVLSEDDR